MSLVYYTATGLNILCNCFSLHNKKTLYLFHIYFYIMVYFIWRGDVLVNNFLIFFSTDLFNEIIRKRHTPFIMFHHILMIIIVLTSKFTNTVNNKLIDLTAIFELTSIPLVLFYMGYIPKPIYNLLFSYTFIHVRLIYFNYTMYNAYLTDRELFTNTTILFYILVNIMNCGIVWKMRLVQKLFGIRPAINYLCDKQPKST